jgi:hypothetical protein
VVVLADFRVVGLSEINDLDHEILGDNEVVGGEVHMGDVEVLQEL